MIASVQHILLRELRALQREIRAYENERDLWSVPAGIANSAGNLALHVAGNLRTFIGARFGNTGYVRDREAEFSRRDVPREEIVRLIDQAMHDVRVGLLKLSEAELDKPYNPEMLGTVTVRDFLMHLAVHLGYHLGQVDYHRRIVTGSSKTVDTLVIPELSTASA